MPKFTQEEIENLNRPKEIETIINNFSKQKTPDSDGINDKFYQTFKEEITPILYNLFKKMEVERILPKPLYKAIITLIPKPKTSQKTTDQYLS